jgi:hypothetical protein
MSNRFPSLAGMDNVKAAGILARAAISLCDENNPAGAFVLPGEEGVREQVISLARQRLGLTAASLSENEIDKIVDFLDDEAESLDEPVDQGRVLESLSAKGELPNDLYEVIVDGQVVDLYQNRRLDVELIRATVRNPDRQYHFVPQDGDPEGVPLVSLFAKHFSHKYLHRSFTLLLSGLRVGLHVHVSSAWRVYADAIPGPSKTLLELLKRFAEEFGLNIRCDGEIGKFFQKVLSEGRQTLSPPSYELHIDDNQGQPLTKDHQIRVSLIHHDKRRPDGMQASILVYAINLVKYANALALHGWGHERSEDFVGLESQKHKSLVLH